MSPLAARTLCECVPVGTSIDASCRGFAGSPTSTSVVPWGAFMWAMNATRPSTTTWPPPGQSKYATCFSPRAEAVDDGAGGSVACRLRLVGPVGHEGLGQRTLAAALGHRSRRLHDIALLQDHQLDVGPL